MSEDLRGEAWQHIQKADSQRQRGLYTDALDTLTKADQLARKAEAPDILSAVLGTTASVLQSKGMFDESLKLHTTALKIQEELAKIDPSFNTWVATTLNNLGALLSEMGRPEDAKIRCERALEMCEALLATDPHSSVYQSWVATTLNNLGALLSEMGRPEDAKTRYERALEMCEALLATDPHSSVYQSSVAATLNNLGDLLRNMGRPEDAKTRCGRALEVREALLATDPHSSVYQSSVAATLNNLGALLSEMGRPEDAKTKYERALEMREALLATDPHSSVCQSDVSMTLNNLGVLLYDMGKPEDAKTRYERALEMREALLATDPHSSVCQLDVSMTLNNLGNLLSDMGRPEDAKIRYERALEMREALLATDPASSVYQSQVAMTLNNLGALLFDMGNKKSALGCYQKSLGIYTEPMKYLTIKAKARAIINIIQLVSGCAQESTNPVQKHVYFKTLYETYMQHDSFFSEYGLVDERRLAKEAGLGAHIQDLMDYARSEKDAGKRIEEYGKCIKEIEPIAEVEDDEELKKVWTSLLYYLKGLQFVNMAIQSKPLDIDLSRKAIEQFEQAKDGYKRAKICHIIYTVLLELADIELMDDKTVLRLKRLLKEAMDNLPENMDNTIKSAFRKIEELLDSSNTNNNSEILMRLYTCITDYIGYDALREYFNHTIHKLVKYNNELFIPSVSYRNWTVGITFDEPEKVQGKLTIKVGDKDIHDKIPKNPRIISIKHISETKKETLTFKDEKSRSIKREITYSEMIHSDDGPLEVYFLGHDCKYSTTDAKLNIAIVQLKYHLNKIGRALVIDDNDAYSRKVKKILHTLKGKVDLVVFPEFSIPSGYLPAMKKYSDETGIVIVAGSHYVTDTTLGNYANMFEHEFTDNDLRKNISPVIIPSSEKMLHIEKIVGAKVERPLFFEEGMIHGSLNRIFRLNNDVTFGVMICFDLLHTELRTRVTDACNVILVPQTNPEPERFYGTGQQEINNPGWAENKVYIMANGIFTYNDGTKENDGTKIMGGKSGVILTLDKDSYKKPEKPIIESVSVGKRKVHEQAILLASLNMNFFAARDTYMGQVPLLTQLIHIFEENEMLESAKDGQNLQQFFNLLETAYSCNDRHELKRILAENGELIRKHSPLMYKNTRDLVDLKTNEIKKKCASIVLN